MSSSGEQNLVSKAKHALQMARQYAFDIAEPDDHWYGELKSNVTLTAENIFFFQWLGIEPIPDADEYQKYILGVQNHDGSWGIAPDYPGDISSTAEAYLALRIIGMNRDTPELEKAKLFIRRSGGLEKARVFTRIHFAMFGLYPWVALPQLPTELIMMPAWFPVNIYHVASWARSSIVPLLILFHHRPVRSLPNGRRATNDYLDELWLDPSNKVSPLPAGSDILSMIINTLDGVIAKVDGMRNFPTRSTARRECVNWILEHQEPQGDWAGIIPPMHFGIQALLCEGYLITNDPIIRGMKAIERFTWHDQDGKRLQASVSPVWDTVLMIRGLCDAGVESDNQRIVNAINWTLERQLNGSEGDWRVYSSHTCGGGFSFEYNNSWYPDTDDTAAVILAFLTHNPASVQSQAVTDAAFWICGMQNRDGGWAAFDINNDKLWLNKLPFSDMKSSCDPSTPDVTGRIIEAFGLMLKLFEKYHVDVGLSARLQGACSRAISYLQKTQEINGSWWGRWAVNYLYGTCNVVVGLSYFEDLPLNSSIGKVETIKSMMARGACWIRRVQNTDGGWGEELESYRKPWRGGCGQSTPSQTAWALMGLLAGKKADVGESAVVNGVKHLLDTQTTVLNPNESASWAERLYTGTGFPNHFYIGYTLYRHCFPLMALGRYTRLAEAQFRNTLEECMRSTDCNSAQVDASVPLTDRYTARKRHVMGCN